MKKILPHMVVFLVVLMGLSLSSWNFLTRPSKQFHFTDLAESWMHGRLDTDTPFRRKGGKALPDDPPGLQEAVDWTLSGKKGGWNDWVSYFEVTLKSGEYFKGVWPWKNRKKGRKGYENRDVFVNLAGDWLTLKSRGPFLRACVAAPDPRNKEARLAWRLRDRHPADRAACADATKDPGHCAAGESRVTCKLRHYFVSFPPMPGVVMLPMVAIWHYHFNDVIFTVVVAALAMVLLLLLLGYLRRQGYSSLNGRERFLLVLLFAFGTVFHFSAIRGQVWYTALIMGVFFNLGYLYFASDLRHPFLAGLFLAMGFATRVTLVFTAVYFLLLLVLSRRRWDRAGQVWRLRRLALFSIAPLAVGVGLMFYNLVRFDSVFEFGHKFLADGTRESVVDHGLFSFWFLSRNLSAALANVPQFSMTWPYVRISGHGLSLLFTTPVFFYLLWPKRGDMDEQEGLDRYRWPLRRVLWITVAATALPGLLYQNTGWFQFGYRFGLDYMPLLFVLLAMDHRKRGWVFYSLVLLAIAVNTFGAITFQRMPVFYH